MQTRKRASTPGKGAELSDGDPRGSAGARPGAVALIIAIFAAWCWAAWANLYWYDLPWADTWASIAPAASGLPPLHINAPLLANFSGSDRVWGLHFPGVPLLYSVVFSCLRFRPELAVLMFMVLWAALAASTGWLAFRVTGQGFWAVAAAAVILADRSLFAIAQAQRPEFITALDLLLVWMALADIWPLRGAGRHLGAGVAFLLLPLLHPVTLVFGAIACAFLVLRAMRRSQRDGMPVAAPCTGYAAGCAALFLWFYLQPDAWSQFCDHANARRIAYTFGRMFFRSLQQFYFPVFTGYVLIGAALIAAVSALIPWLLGRPQANRVTLVGAVILVLCALIQQNFQNGLYLTLYLPVCVVFAMGLLARLESAGERGRWVRVLACAAIAVHGVFWAGRTFRFFQSGRPHIREELTRIVEELPKGRRILIPEGLWEAAIRDPSRFDLNTLPQVASPGRRRAYEALVYGRLSAGDAVVVDRLQLNQPVTDFLHGGWTKGKQFTHVFPGRTEWGYDMTVWIKAPN
jgi:hypothetical protein